MVLTAGAFFMPGCSFPQGSPAHNHRLQCFGLCRYCTILARL